MDQVKVDVLGVKINDNSEQEVLQLVEEWLGKREKHYIVTPNPEFIIAALTDQKFKEVLNKADLAIPDGVGLQLFGKIKNRVAGTDLVDSLCQMVSKRGFTVGFLGGKNGVAKKAAECLSKKYPGLKIVFAEDGSEVDMEGEELSRGPARLAEANGEAQAGTQPHPMSSLVTTSDILFVGFGQIKQEKWIASNLKKLPIKVAIGVGGAFDYISGRVPRAPFLMRQLGLEWLFRLMIQPWRIKRQLALLHFIRLMLAS